MSGSSKSNLLTKYITQIRGDQWGERERERVIEGDIIPGQLHIDEFTSIMGRNQLM